MADYWIKVYHEIIDDPKMATMPDRLWRRTIEVFLLAGKLSKDKSGQLPDTNQLAWLLRMSTDDLLMDLSQLANAGIVKKNDMGWVVTNFEKRQAASSNTERVQQFRERQRKQQYYGNETQMKRNVTQINRIQNTESETETETETETNITSSSGDFAKLVREYEQNIGVITNKTSDLIFDDLEQYGYELCSKAITEAVRQNKRTWAYVQGILKRWWANGYKHELPKNGKQKKYQEQWKDGQLIFVPIKEVVNES